MAMSSSEWSHYLHETVGLRESPETIKEEVVRCRRGRYERELQSFEALRALAEGGCARR